MYAPGQSRCRGDAGLCLWLLLPAQALGLPGLGCINIHTSLLPRWRGAAPIQHALLAGDKETGISFMRMAEALDAGPVLHQKRCKIRTKETAASLRARLVQLACDELAGVLDGLACGKLSAAPQDPGEVCFAPKIRKSEACIDWQESAIRIERRVRAFNDWPVAYSYLEEQRVRIWEAHALARKADGPAGTVLGARKGIEVATGEGVLGIDRLQLPGGKPLSAHDFINAHDLRGLRFDRKLRMQR